MKDQDNIIVIDTKKLKVSIEDRGDGLSYYCNDKPFQILEICVDTTNTVKKYSLNYRREDTMLRSLTVLKITVSEKFNKKNLKLINFTNSTATEYGILVENNTKLLLLTTRFLNILEIIDGVIKYTFAGKFECDDDVLSLQTGTTVKSNDVGFMYIKKQKD